MIHYTRRLAATVKNLGSKQLEHVVQVLRGETSLGEMYEPKDMRDKFVKAIENAPASASRWAAAEKKVNRAKPKN